MAGRFSVEAVFKAIDRITAPVNRMQNRVGKFTRGMERRFRSVDRVVSKVARGITSGIKAAGAAATVAITGLGFAIQGLAADADALAKQSRRLDFPIEDLQEWRFTFEQAGVDQKLFNSSLGAFSKRLGEARAGMGPLRSGLKKSHPELLRQLQATDDISQALEIYIEAMRNAPTAVDRAALANAAFSRSGLKLANITDLDAEAIAGLRNEMRENGLITRQQAEASEAYNDAMNSLGLALTGFKQQVLLPLLPQLTKVARAFREWAVTNREVVSGQVLDFFRKLAANFESIVTWAKRIGLAIGVFFTLMAVLKSFIVVMTAVNLVMALNPIGLVVLAIGAVIAAVAAAIIWWDELKAAFLGMSDSMIVAIAALTGPVGWMIGAAGLIAKHWEPIKAFFVDLWADVVQTFDKYAGKVLGVVDKVTRAAGAIRGAVSNAGGQVAGFFGFGEDEQEAERPSAAPAMVSPQERTARMIEERRESSTSEVTIKDETGRAQVTSGKLGRGLKLEPSGAF